jgi:hypothetical protein
MLIHTMVALFTTFLVVAPAPAQTTPKSGTFASLSPGNQKIARALYEAQTTPATSSKLTLDQIARMKQEGQGWGNVFRAMKAEGRVDAWNLGAVVSASKHQASTPVAASATSGSGTGGSASGGTTSSTATTSTARGKSDKASTSGVSGSASTKTVGPGRVATTTVSTGAGPAKAIAVGTARGHVKPGK